MIYEGYRDINEPGSIRISTAYNSKELAFPKPHCCETHEFCSHDQFKLMDPTHQEESVPLPLPVDKQYQAAYLKEDFENRLRGAKTSLVVHGQVRQIGEREPIKIMMPTTEDLDRWVEVSKKFGQEIKREKELQRSLAKGLGQDIKAQNGSQRVEMMNQLKPEHKGVPFLSLNPTVQKTSDLNQPMYSHVPRSLLFPKEVKAKEPRSQRQKVKNKNEALITADKAAPQTLDKTSQHAIDGTFIELNTLADRKRTQNKEPWSKRNEIKNPLTYLKNKKFYDKLGQAEKLMQTQKTALAQMKVDNAPPKNEDEERQIEGIRAKKHQQVSQLCIQNRKKEAAQIRQQQAMQIWPANLDPSYPNDLRVMYHKGLESVKENEDKRLNISKEAWEDAINLQDQWQRLSEFAGQSLKNMSSEPDPVLIVSKLPSVKLQRTIKPDFIPLNSKSEVRVKNIQEYAKRVHAENKREDLGILAYMRRNGLEKQENYYNSDATVREFRRDTAFHPQYLVRPEAVTVAASQVVETDDSIIAPPIITVTKDDDSDASGETHVTDHTQGKVNQASMATQSRLLIDSKQSNHEQSRISATSKQVSKAEFISGHSSVAPSLHGELSSDNIYMNSDFWYHKGVVLNQKNQTDSAVACYHQALDINKNHLPSIFNLACNYQKLKQLEKAKHWFKHAINVQPDWSDALYGLCLVNIKLKCSAEAVKYIKKAMTLKGSQDSPHILYALALAYRADLDWDNSLKSYSTIMKNEQNIFQYRKMIDAENQKIVDNNLTEDFGGLNLKIDLYSHFKELGIERKYANDIDLWHYYDPYEGWDYDSIDIVIDLLKRVRFFNRFDSEMLKNMLTKVTMRRLEKNQVLFFKGEEASIVISGKLHLISHELDLATPFVATTYNPGDCIGLDIDNGWSDAEHSWIVSWQVCDVFMISDGYLSYMWDSMKRFSSNLIADMLDKDQYLTQLSEQTLFTIAHDIARLREYQDGEVILVQSTSSRYNLTYQRDERLAMNQFLGKDDKQLQEMKDQFKKDCLPHPNDIRKEIDAKIEFNDARAKILEEEKNLKIRYPTLGNKKGFDDSESLASDGFASGGQRDSRNNFNSQKSLNGPFDSMRMAELRANKAKADEKMFQVMEGIYNAKENCKKLVQNNIERLQNYQNERKKLPIDADGIYIIISGQAKVVNQLDPNVELKRIYYYDPVQDQQKNARGELKICPEEEKKFGDYFGASKFLQEQGYCVFGDIIACADQSNPKKKLKGNDPVTTCLFLSKDLLYLIPFYDLYMLKEINRKRLDMKKLRKDCHSSYKDRIRNMNDRLLKK